MKKMLFLTLLSISLILGVTPMGNAGNPLPPPKTGYEYRIYVGPDITGTLTYELYTDENGNPNTAATFDGQCKKLTFSGYVDNLGPGMFEDVSVDYLLGTGEFKDKEPQQLYVPKDCSSSKEGALPAVYKVLDYSQPDPFTKIFRIIGRFTYQTLIK